MKTRPKQKVNLKMIGPASVFSMGQGNYYLKTDTSVHIGRTVYCVNIHTGELVEIAQDDYDVLRRDLVARLDRFHAPEQEARTMANQDHARARTEHNEQEEA